LELGIGSSVDQAEKDGAEPLIGVIVLVGLLPVWNHYADNYNSAQRPVEKWKVLITLILTASSANLKEINSSLLLLSIKINPGTNARVTTTTK
jgi:hypothetical protein